MISATLQEAIAIVEKMVEDKHAEVTSLNTRIMELELEQARDPNELTSSYLAKLRVRRIKRSQEANALEVVLDK